MTSVNLTHKDCEHKSVASVLRLLLVIKDTEDGLLLYEHVEEMLLSYCVQRLQLAQGYTKITQTLLNALGERMELSPSSRTHLQALHEQLAASDSIEELGQINEFLGRIIAAKHRPLNIMRADSIGQPNSEDTIPGAALEPWDQNHKTEDAQKFLQYPFNHIEETISHSNALGERLSVLRDELQKMDAAASDPSLRDSLAQEITSLESTHGELSERLDKARTYIQTMETNSNWLSLELNRVRLLSLTDELTNLANRRAFLRRLDDEVGRAQRYGHSVTITMIDLDYFKRINDKFGHAAGDEVLKNYADSIRSAFRQSDLIARYGGEEFVVLMPNTNLDGAIKALNKIGEIVTNGHWNFQGSDLPLPTFSAGVAVYQSGETPAAFVERADNALYKAKKMGRDRVEIDTTYGSVGLASGRESNLETSIQANKD